MSLDLHPSIYYAIRVARSEFFSRTEEKIRVCFASPNKHRVENNYCSECGSKTAFQDKEIATEAFQKFCASENTTPEETFKALQEEGLEWVEGELTLSIKLHEINLYVDPGAASDIVYGLGFQIVKGQSQRGNHQEVLGFSAYALEDLNKPLKEAAESLGVQGEPKVYVSVYLSY